ncbi:glycogen debranching protein GlgX [Candidatus Accumulibacter sp. ACC007]|uniref:glycogen debranching protein GlgX n=1 Tax=Candidatus Accumulibacter sp. ACC007 TaxID=2823333 RepID=UPI0025BDBAEE|nr:glycogen debranching protein GlgX [Candidatus Accumulibacter sp. ACC007]
MDTRIDFYPTNQHGAYKLRPGRPYPFGTTLVPGGVNFSISSGHATACTLVLFEKGAPEPFVEIPFPEAFRVGNVWCMVVFDLECERIEYGYRMDGPWDPGAGHRFDRSKVLLDPYAKAIGGRTHWGQPPDWNDIYPQRARLIFEDFDWEDDRPLETPLADLVIYELHTRSFTAHPSADVKHPGTYAGIAARIPYLKELGVNCVELMPIFEFDEFENSRANPETGEMMLNYWGYSTVGFFAPKAGFAATGPFGMEVDEFKNLVKELHRNGIEVMLDVVFNHTAEGNENGPTLSFRGIDNQTFYMLTPEGYYYNFSGCGNTLNCNSPVVRNMVLDCLRYWAAEYHIDGFRFDLASILGRAPSGAPLPNPPLLESLAFDPVLAKCKLIAEAWDAGGLYQVGSFPAYGRWAEWNGKYRDDIRRFLKGDEGMVPVMAERIQGSPDLYGWNERGPTASINFITCHDGFTLHDLFTYNDKHNDDNGEHNRDGGNDNHSWNCGAEGETDDAQVNALRQRMIRNALAILLMSHGVPMLLMGDELGRTQRGNNNTYCHDNELNWLDWTLRERNSDLFDFTRKMIALRKAHPLLRTGEFFGTSRSPADIIWHGTQAWKADWSEDSRALAFLLRERQAGQGGNTTPVLYMAINSFWDALPFELPELPSGYHWHLFANTSLAAPDDIREPGEEIPLQENLQSFLVGGRAVAILIGRPRLPA